METWFCVKRYGWHIEKKEFERSTDHFLHWTWPNGVPRRTAKASTYENYYPTFSEAVKAVIDRLERDVERTMNAYLEARSDFDKAVQAYGYPKKDKS